MGIVFLARDTRLDRDVALKLPKADASDPNRIARFEREARSAACLRHPNICPVFDVGEIDGIHYITMAYVDGQSLSQTIATRKNLQLDGLESRNREAARLVFKLADALEEAHRKGVIHRDLKPSNIMVDGRGEPTVTDFGLARQMNLVNASRVTASGSLIGTPAYMSPEQVRGEELAGSTDIYSLGVVLYEILTGAVPFSGTTGAVIGKILNEEPVSPSVLDPEVDLELEAICQRMMAKRTEDRYRSMADVSRALAAFLEGKGARANFGRSDGAARRRESPLVEAIPFPPQTLAGRDTQTITSNQPTERISTGRDRLYAVLRWIGCAPAAIVASLLAHFVVLLFIRWSMEFSRYDPDSFFGKILCFASSGAVLGAVAVQVAANVAPTGKKTVAAVAVGTVLLWSGWCLQPSLVERDWWSIYQLVWINLGAIGIGYSVFRHGSGSQESPVVRALNMDTESPEG